MEQESSFNSEQPASASATPQPASPSLGGRDGSLSAHQGGPIAPRKRVKMFLIVVGALAFVIAVASVVWFFVRGLAERNAQRAPTIEQTRVDSIPNDLDRDGLTNEEEATASTSPTEFDTDHDGLSDLDEIRVWKTDPKNTDTDGDGFGDGVEVLRGFNPNGAGMLKK